MYTSIYEGLLNFNSIKQLIAQQKVSAQRPGHARMQRGRVQGCSDKLSFSDNQVQQWL